MSAPPENKQYKIDSSVKVLLKEQFPGVKARPATISVLSRATCEFMKLVVSASARVCEEQKKNIMTVTHVTKGLEDLEMTQYVEPVGAKGAEINERIKKRKEEDLKDHCDDGLTQDERIAAAKRLRDMAMKQLAEDRKAGKKV